MNWFKGPIENAILQSKKDQLIFLVYAFDPNSTEMDLVWNDEEVYAVCSKECVALKLDSTTEAFKQFSEIYKVLCLPSTFFIGDNGMPLEIVAGAVSVEDFMGRMNKALELQNNLKRPVAAAVSSDTSTASSSSDATKSLNDKVAEAREKIKALQQQKLDEEKERERNAEMERRRIGQEMIKAKQLKEEQDFKRLAEDRKREKLNDELAKKKVLEQIQRDREEKQKKYEKEKQEKGESDLKKKQEVEQLRQQQAALAAEEAKNSPFARIQFRLIDGSSIVDKFESTKPLSDIRAFLVEKLRELNYTQSFSMHTTHPKRVFNDADFSSTLKDLGLAPTATILVMPSQGRSNPVLGSSLPVASNGFFGIISTLASFLLIPVSFLWNLVSGFFGTNTNRTQQRSAQPTQRPSVPSDDLATFTQPQAETPAAATNYTASDIRLNRSRLLDNYSSNSKDENLRKREPFKKEGNIARLNDNGDEDDDDTNTWNGNSTQQM